MNTTIRMLTGKAVHAGHCAVCKAPAILKWHDSETGSMGDCCYGAVVQADKNLMAASFERPEGQYRED